MIVVLVPILIAVVIYGGYKLYLLEAALLGVIAAAVTFALATAALAALGVYGWHRHRVLHGHRVGGRRILELSGEWGRLALNAEEKRGRLTLKGQDVRFIFGDIAGVAHDAQCHSHALMLRLRDNAGSPWRVPMASDRQARDWQEILNLAARKKL